MSKDHGNEISRRDFLKSLGALAIFPMLPKVSFGKRGEPSSPTLEKEERGHSWSREEYLTNPLLFFDEIVSKIESLKKESTDELPSPLLNFLQTFSEKTIEAGENNDQLEFRIKYREQVAKGYELYGKRISDLADRIDILNPNMKNSYLYVGGNFNAFNRFWIAFHVLKEIFIDKTLHISAFTYDHYDDLTIIHSWFQSLSDASDYESQRKLYIEDAISSTDRSGFEEKIHQVWDGARRLDHEPEENGVIERRTTKREKRFIEMTRTLRSIFPAIFTGIDSFDFTSRKGRRAHYIDHESDIYMGNSFFRAMDALEKYDIAKDLNSSEAYNALHHIDEFCYVALHEAGHNRDLSGKGRYWGTHPSDFLDFVDTRVDFLETFENYIHGNSKLGIQPLTSYEIKMWFLDPLSARCFGVDELNSDVDFARYEGELSQLIRILESLDNLPNHEGEKLLRMSQLEELFQNDEAVIENWIVHLYKGVSERSGLPEEHTPFGKLQMGDYQGLKSISSMSGISPKVLTEMLELSRDMRTSTLSVSNLSASEKYQISETLLDIKFFSLFSIYAVLDRLSHDGHISDTKHPNLYYNYISLKENYIYDQLLHAQVGPYGEYMPENAYYTLLIPQPMQVDQSIESAIRQRKLTDLTYFFDSENKTIGLVECLETLNKKLLKDQESMAKVMGARPNGDGSYLENYEHIVSLVSQSIGLDFDSTSYPV